MARARVTRFNVVSLALGFAFLYLPIVILVIYSFNASRLVTVWGPDNRDEDITRTITRVPATDPGARPGQRIPRSRHPRQPKRSAPYCPGALAPRAVTIVLSQQPAWSRG